LLIALGVAAIVAFALSGDPTNRTLILSEADGAERQVCASRATVDEEPGAQEGRPLLPGPVEVWFVADPPTDLARILCARWMYVGHHDDWLPGTSVATDMVPIRCTSRTSWSRPWAGTLAS
jgi:hypothetical protein